MADKSPHPTGYRFSISFSWSFHLRPQMGYALCREIPSTSAAAMIAASIVSNMLSHSRNGFFHLHGREASGKRLILFGYGIPERF